MDLKLGASIHNRFDIRVIRDGKVIQEASAENIVLDRMYTRICQFATYFDYIHFGTGTGTQSASRTTLFTATSYKSATTVETIYAFPTSKITKKIQINPSEYVGSVLTEVGISESTSNINTHALIKDAEGIQISITKTALDLVEIYATVYIELVDTDIVVFNRNAGSNSLLNYFINQTAPSYSIATYIDKSIAKKPYGVNSTKTTTLSYSSASKTSTWGTIRFEVADSNTDIYKVGIPGMCFTSIPNVSTFNGTDITDSFTGDGSNTRFNIAHVPSGNISVMVGGVSTSDFAVCYRPRRVYALRGDYGSYSYRIYSASKGFVWFDDMANVNSKFYRVFRNSEGVFNTVSDIGGAPSDLQPIGIDNDTVFYRGSDILGNSTVYLYNYDSVSNTMEYSGFSCYLGQYIPNQAFISPDATYLFIYMKSNTSYDIYSRYYKKVGSVYIYQGGMPYNFANGGLWVNNEVYMGVETSAIYTKNVVTGVSSYDNSYKSVIVSRYNGKIHFISKENASPYVVTHKIYSNLWVEESSESFNLGGSSNEVKAYNYDKNIAICYTGTSLEAFTKVGEGNFISLGTIPYESYPGVGGPFMDRGYIYYIGEDLYYYSYHGGGIISDASDLQGVVFNTPPASGAVITASYHTDCIPKTTDYVLDVGFTLQFGEGSV